MKRISILLLTLIVLTLCLASCKSTPPLTGEEQMKVDILASDQFIANSLKIESLTVNDRKSDAENKTDTVYVTVSAKNDIVSCTYSYVLKYYLYDQGWALESLTRDESREWAAKPLKGADRALADEKCKNGVFSEAIEDLESGICKFIYNETIEHVNCVEKKEHTVVYKFEPYKAVWEYDTSASVTAHGFEWDIEGTWNGTARKGTLTSGWSEGIVVTISDFNVTDLFMTVEYPEEGIIFEGTVEFDFAKGLEADVIHPEDSWDSVTVIIQPDGASLKGRGTRSTEYLVREE